MLTCSENNICEISYLKGLQIKKILRLCVVTNHFFFLFFCIVLFFQDVDLKHFSISKMIFPRMQKQRARRDQSDEACLVFSVQKSSLFVFTHETPSRSRPALTGLRRCTRKMFRFSLKILNRWNYSKDFSAPAIDVKLPRCCHWL